MTNPQTLLASHRTGGCHQILRVDQAKTFCQDTLWCFLLHNVHFYGPHIVSSFPTAYFPLTV